MSETTSSTATVGTTAPQKFEIVPDNYRGYGYLVLYDGIVLTDRYASQRNFSTQNSARKAITRAKRPAGDRHR